MADVSFLLDAEMAEQSSVGAILVQTEEGRCTGGMLAISFAAIRHHLFAHIDVLLLDLTPNSP